MRAATSPGRAAGAAGAAGAARRRRGRGPCRAAAAPRAGHRPGVEVDVVEQRVERQRSEALDHGVDGASRAADPVLAVGRVLGDGAVERRAPLKVRERLGQRVGVRPEVEEDPVDARHGARPSTHALDVGEVEQLHEPRPVQRDPPLPRAADDVKDQRTQVGRDVLDERHVRPIIPRSSTHLARGSLETRSGLRSYGRTPVSGSELASSPRTM